MSEAVARHGLTPVGTAGEAFTPELHEAVGFDAEADVEAGAVARVLQSGYKLGERLLRDFRAAEPAEEQAQQENPTVDEGEDEGQDEGEAPVMSM